jgi:broad specificity phosphatase PhoE
MSKWIFIVRHAQTDMNAEEVYYDNHIDEHDIPINMVGQKQAKLTAKYLSNICDKLGNFDTIISSPRLRCVETATAISNRSNNSIITDDRLLEGKAGKFHGVKHSEMISISQQDREFMKLYNERSSMEPIARALYYKEYNEQLDVMRVRDGESSLLKRMKGYNKFINQIIASKHKRICIVGHSGTLNGLLQIMIGTEKVQNGKIVDKFGNCAITCILYSKKNPFIGTNGDYKFYLITAPNNEHLQKMYPT